MTGKKRGHAHAAQKRYEAITMSRTLRQPRAPWSISLQHRAVQECWTLIYVQEDPAVGRRHDLSRRISPFVGTYTGERMKSHDW
jgi:hypothetical protein